MRATCLYALQTRCRALLVHNLLASSSANRRRYTQQRVQLSSISFEGSSAQCSALPSALRSPRTNMGAIRRISQSTPTSDSKEVQHEHHQEQTHHVQKNFNLKKITGLETPEQLSDSIMLTDAEQAIQQCVTIEDFNSAIKFHASTNPSHGHVAYIRSTLAHLEKTKQKPTLETYDALLSVLPQNSHLVNRSLLDAIWPKMSAQSELAMDILLHMEERGVIPEASTHALLLRVFGAASGPVLKCRRLVYWMRRFSFINPYRLEHIPEEPAEVATCLLQRIGGPASDVEVIRQAPDFVYAVHTEHQSREMADICANAQRRSIDPTSARPKSFQETTFMIDGPFYTWFLGKQQPYYVLAGVTSNLKEDCAEQPVASVDSGTGLVTEELVDSDVDETDDTHTESGDAQASRRRGLPTGLAYTNVLSTCVFSNSAGVGYDTMDETSSNSDETQPEYALRASLDRWIDFLQERHEGFAAVPMIVRARPTTATAHAHLLLDGDSNYASSTRGRHQWHKRKTAPP
eukprot:m.302774 g.302774  ORF g.302774 m.302774 type:complete len:518 (+) comp20154_c0_seq3:226-1779(+)